MMGIPTETGVYRAHMGPSYDIVYQVVWMDITEEQKGRIDELKHRRDPKFTLSNTSDLFPRVSWVDQLSERQWHMICGV
jgi:hypothetical protein